MTETNLLKLPYILPSQAQKHVTHNEALRLLDGIVQLSVLSRDVSAPPGTAAEGDRYVVASGATGEWAGHDGEIAIRVDGGWSFVAPRSGWIAWLSDEERLIVRDGSEWVSPLSNFETLGVNAEADTVSRFAVASDATLFDHDGAGHQHKINKSTASDTASLIFQTGYSGRAEFGTVGNDNFSIKVSTDGTTWKEPMRVDAASGVSTFNNMSIRADSGAAFEIDLQDGSSVFRATRYFNAAPGPVFFGAKARGSRATPAAVQANDTLLGFRGYGHTGTGFLSGADGVAFLLEAAETFVHGTNYGTQIRFMTTQNGTTANFERLRITDNGTVRPGADNAATLGSAMHRWSALWAANGTIQTSDARDKAIAGPLDFAAPMVDAIDPVLFRWLVGGNSQTSQRSVSDELQDGEVSAELTPRAGARLHAGFVAQDLKAAMDAAGVDFGAWGLDDKNDPASRQWTRPDQLIAVLWAALKETRMQVARLMPDGPAPAPRRSGISAHQAN